MIISHMKYLIELFEYILLDCQVIWRSRKVELKFKSKFDAVIKEIFFLNFFSSCSLLVHRKITDFCVLMISFHLAEFDY